MFRYNAIFKSNEHRAQQKDVSDKKNHGKGRGQRGGDFIESCLCVEWEKTHLE